MFGCVVWMKEKSRMPAIAASIAAEHEGEDLVARDRQAGEPGGDRVAADRDQPEAEQRAVEQPADDHREHQHPQHLERDRVRADSSR